MHKPTETGKNRTGIATSPLDSKKTIKGAHATPSTYGDTRLLEAERTAWSEQAEPVGTMPVPASPKAVVKTAIKALKGEHLNVLLDKLGARLAFERTGTRLYQALLSKFEAAHVHEGGPTRADLEEIRDEERSHMQLVERAILELGGDPTVVTPSADIASVASMGIIQVLADPRSTFTQCLDCMLMAELADNDSWASLVELAEELGLDELARDFRVALRNEGEHVERVREWLTTAVRGQAGVEPS